MQGNNRRSDDLFIYDSVGLFLCYDFLAKNKLILWLCHRISDFSGSIKSQIYYLKEVVLMLLGFYYPDGAPILLCIIPFLSSVFFCFGSSCLPLLLKRLVAWKPHQASVFLSLN